MKIAVLGWGSLIWDPGSLQLKGAWQPDGPLLPVEYLHVTERDRRDERLTLVVHAADWIRQVRTLWCESALDGLEDARRDLARRERITATDPLSKVGYVVSGEGDLGSRAQMTSVADPATRSKLLRSIDDWRRSRHLDAVVWTDLAASPDVVTVDAALNFVARLVQRGSAAKAEEYVRRTPAQVRTVVRDSLETAQAWLPQGSPSVIASGDDLRAKEWSECRAAIGRFDAILVDLRKYGFSVIAGLLSASAFLGLFGITTSATENAAPLAARLGALAAIQVLLVALFLLDTYYEVLLSAAVERAMDLETQTSPPIRLSKYLSINSMSASAVQLTALVYYVLYGIVWLLAIAMVATAFADPVPATAWISAVALVGGVLLYQMWSYRAGVQERVGVRRFKAGRIWPGGENALEKLSAPPGP